MEFLIPDWPAPKHVKALVTLRSGGVSKAPFDSFNLASHVGDDLQDVNSNRAQLRKSAELPGEPMWLNQVHGVSLVTDDSGHLPEADGAITSKPGKVCAVLTADCLPIFLCYPEGNRVGVLHAGWRGLLRGIVGTGISVMAAPGSELLAWLGPAIGSDVFEVGSEVRQQFLDSDNNADGFFRPRGNKWLLDIYGLARSQLESLGVTRVTGGNLCTYSDSDRFFSYRRDGQCGRMASLIWMES